MTRLLLSVLCVALAGGTARAEVLRYGHSEHGPAFDSGPRRRATLDPGQGKVHFPITATADAQRFFDQGIAQFHGFQWYEAERSFREALFRDPDCAMALWGMAMVANGDVWFHEPRPRGRELARQALALRHRLALRGKPLTPREDAYLDALAVLTEAGSTPLGRMAMLDRLRAIVRAYPQDVEAKAFLAFELLKNDDLYKPPGSSWLTRPSEGFLREADGLVDAVLARDPFHPAHHYKIHIWDFHEPERAAGSTDPIGPSAPHIAHMWHMAGHIHWRALRYAEAAWQQEASARVDHAYYRDQQVMPFLNVNYLHNNDWLTESLGALGRMHDALALSLDMVELPRHPRFNTFATSSGLRGRDDLMDTLNLFEMWPEVERYANDPHLTPVATPEEEVKRVRLLGLAHYRLGKRDALAADIARLQAMREPAGAGTAAAGTDRPMPAPQLEAPTNRVKPVAEERADVARELSEALLELSAYRDLLSGDRASARAALGRLEPLVQPPIDWEDRRRGLLEHQLAQALADAGDWVRAVRAAREGAAGYPHQVVPQAVLAEVLARAGRTAEAREVLAALAHDAGFADRDLPVLRRLRARGLELHADPPGYRFRQPQLHPPLASLGPLTWQPGLAPPLPSDAPRGQAVLVVLNLGSGCEHCNRQLAKLNDALPALKSAGIATSIVRYDRAQRDRFRAWRAYDEFEDQPLHGTYLVSADGHILWEDIGADPFTDFEGFLVAESRRLLALRGVTPGRTPALPRTSLP